MSDPMRDVLCREIETTDLDSLIDLLTQGYKISKRGYWERRIQRLSQHLPPSQCPKFGFLLECGGAVKGVLFTIFSQVVIRGVTKIRGYPVTLYIDPEYRGYAAFLSAKALRYKDVTYIMRTPVRHVLPILAAQGYVRYCEGRFVSLPALSRQRERARIDLAPPDLKAGDGLTPFEVELLSRHAGFDCISLVCTTSAGRYPFVFHPRRKGGIIPFVRLVYCRDFADFTRFAAPIGRFLLRHGYPFVVLDADGPIPGLVGHYSPNLPKQFKGPDRPRLGDFAYSSRVIFDD